MASPCASHAIDQMGAVRDERYLSTSTHTAKRKCRCDAGHFFLKRVQRPDNSGLHKNSGRFRHGTCCIGDGEREASARRSAALKRRVTRSRAIRQRLGREKFKAETGIPVYKWMSVRLTLCRGVKQVEAELGPVDVLINNAHHRDGAFHKMTLEQWNAVINTNLGSLFT